MQNRPIATTASELDYQLSHFLRGYDYVDRRNIIEFTEKFCLTFRLTSIPRNPVTLLPEVFGIQIRPSEELLPTCWIRDDERDRYFINVGPPGKSTIEIELWHELFEIMSSNEKFPSLLGSKEECRLANLFALLI